MTKQKTVMYGSIYQDEMPKYRDVISEQFRHCAKYAENHDQEIIRWAFDYVAESKNGNPIPVNKIFKKMALDYAKECADTYMKGVKSV